MVGSLARYDEFARWYEQWTSGFGPTLISTHPELMPTLSGLRVLDLACGHGRLARDLVRAGARVVGVDVSAALLDKARANDSDWIDYIQADVTRTPSWWDGHPFDGCTCELAMMDIDDLSGAISTVAAVLRHGGWFVASIVHPCFPGNDNGLSSWPPNGDYETEGWWTSQEHNPNGARIRVGATHRKLSTYLEWPARCWIRAGTHRRTGSAYPYIPFVAVSAALTPGLHRLQFFSSSSEEGRPPAGVR